MGQQVTSLTAEKSLELADENVVDAVVSGGHLILRRRNWDPDNPTDPATIIDAGSVIGPPGPPTVAGAKIVAQDFASTADDPLGGTADTFYALAGVSVTTPALVVGHKYAVEYYAPLNTPTDLTNWDLELTESGSGIHRANAFAPNGGRLVVASGTYYFTASGTAAKTFGMRARATTASSGPAAFVDNSFVQANITVIDYGS